MPEQRYVYRVGTSHVVALPPRVREHLGILAGDSVHWHLVRGKEAVLSTKAQREGGRPEGLALTRQLEATRTELERLRRRVAARPLRVMHEGVGIGVHQAMESLFPVEDRLRAIEEALEDLRARLPFRRRYPRAPAPRSGESPVAAGSVDAIPLSDPPSTPEVVDGGADTSGAEPPGVPRET
jgi:antitoxin component of MazEF toxin-antitoxin module